MDVLSTITAISEAGKSVADIGQFIAALYGGVKAAEETEKAQAYKEKWTDKIFSNELRQQTIQNKLAKEQLGMSKAAQYFNQQLALRNEARTDKDRWRQDMQNAANKYSEILNNSRALRTANAAALKNR